MQPDMRLQQVSVLGKCFFIREIIQYFTLWGRLPALAYCAAFHLRLEACPLLGLYMLLPIKLIDYLFQLRYHRLIAHGGLSHVYQYFSTQW